MAGDGVVDEKWMKDPNVDLEVEVPGSQIDVRQEPT
jgi:hypothetical protein